MITKVRSPRVRMILRQVHYFGFVGFSGKFKFAFGLIWITSAAFVTVQAQALPNYEIIPLSATRNFNANSNIVSAGWAALKIDRVANKIYRCSASVGKVNPSNPNDFQMMLRDCYCDFFKPFNQSTMNAIFSLLERSFPTAKGEWTVPLGFWSVDQKSGEVTFCSLEDDLCAQLTIRFK